jgi:hypothetical protein
MPAITYPRLVKIATTSVQANLRSAKTAASPVATKSVGGRFIAVLLSALSAWGA